MRADVLNALESELEYQHETKGSDEYTSFGDFATFMRRHLFDMDMALSKGDFLTAQDSLRKVTTLGVSCMARHGAKPRTPNTVSGMFIRKG